MQFEQPQMRIHWGRLAALLLVVLLVARTSFAFETRVEERTLGGHTFMQPIIQALPTVTRSYAMTTAVGYSQLDVDGIDDTLDFAAFGLQAHFQQPVDDRLALTFDLFGNVIAATGEDAALTLAANGEWSLTGGLLYNWIDEEDYAISFTGKFGGGQEYQASPGVAINEAVESGEISTEGLLVLSKNFEMDLGATGAYGFNEWFGVYGNSGYGLEYSNPDNEGSTDSHNFILGVGTSIDANAAGIPLGFTLGYELNQEMNNDSATANLLEFGLRYAPNEHFNLGLSVIGTIAELNDDVDIQEWTGTLGLVYYH